MIAVDWLREERLAYSQGRRTPAGIDEAGRGALAGPVVAACVVLPANCIPAGVNDSKKLSPEQRDICFENIQNSALAIGIGIVSEVDIDTINILKATHEAMREALREVQRTITPDIALIDGLPVRAFPLYQKAIVKGDGLSVSIASASIAAKVTRDRLMVALDVSYPGYGFATHKGYGTPEHLNAIRALGPCPAHRLTFQPIASMLATGIPSPRSISKQQALDF